MTAFPKRQSFLWVLLLGPLLTIGQPASSLEKLINHYLQAYPFSPENAFRLATYLELKGDYDPEQEVMTVRFGDLGSMNFYESSCLLRAGRYGVYSLDGEHGRPVEVEAMNQALSALFEQIFLMGNAGLDRGIVRRVDRYLIKKNINPFDKILLHHILVRYGRYDSARDRIELHTDWFPDRDYTYRAHGEPTAYRKPKTPLYLKLERGRLRGYYLEAGGTVYAEDVDRAVLYATGEDQSPSTTAFKLFAQRLFTQSTLYLIRSEQRRLAKLELKTRLPDRFDAGELPVLAGGDVGFRPASSSAPLPAGYRRQQDSLDALYHPYHWVPMMLGMLRSEGVSVADPDILPYFMDADYFGFIYDLLTPAEQKAVDRWRRRRDAE